MSKNPYKVLGVSPEADDEEIKRAYRELARKYHPYRYTDSDLADLASEKMKEVNAAYEEIQHMRAGGGQSTGAQGGAYHTGRTHQGGAYTGGYYSAGPNPGASYENTHYSADAREKFTLIRQCINNRNISEAERLLSEIAAADRGAEWHFLTGCVQMAKGFYVDAQHSFDTAYRMEPTNNEYWTFREQLHNRSQQFGGGYQTTRSSECCDCDCCTSLICADCCCECMGGDLVPCC